MTHKQNDPYRGATVFWRQAPVPRAALRELLASLDLAELMPAETADASCLRYAMSEVAKQKATERGSKAAQLVQSLKKPKKNGYEVLDVEKGEEGNQYDRDFAAKMTEHGIVVHRGWCDEERLNSLFREAKAVTTASAVSTMLATFCERYDGTPFKTGTYWIPDQAVQRFNDLCGGLNGLNEKFEGYPLKFVLDEHGLKAIRDALVAEITESVERINREVAKGDLKEQALIKRQIEGAALKAKLSRYEELLGETVSVARDAIGACMEAAASATAALDSANVYGEVFA